MTRYQYDGNGNRTLKAGVCLYPNGSLAEQTISYGYDQMDRLISEVRNDEETTYFYDLCGNRLKKLDKDSEEAYNYNQKNQLVSRSWNSGNTAYEYDLQGNLLTATGTEGLTAFSYNAFNEQISVAMPNGNRLESRYDAEYLRAGTTQNGSITSFSYYNGELLAESSPDGDTISRYILGYGVAAGWNREKEGYHPYHLDEQNSTAYITGINGGIENHYQYDAFGVVQTHQEEIHNRIFYTGQQYDQSSGQYYLRARYYNPVVGRFLQEDVYHGDGLNLYAYCKNNPVVYYDPSGYNDKEVCTGRDEGESGVAQINPLKVKRQSELSEDYFNSLTNAGSLKGGGRSGGRRPKKEYQIVIILQITDMYLYILNCQVKCNTTSKKTS